MAANAEAGQVGFDYRLPAKQMQLKIQEGWLGGAYSQTTPCWTWIMNFLVQGYNVCHIGAICANCHNAIVVLHEHNSQVMDSFGKT